MTTRERFKAVMSFKEVDRIPVIEWASWWDKTLNRWRKEGLPAHLNNAQDIMEYLGLDVHKQFWPPTVHGPGYMSELTDEGYNKIRPHILHNEAVSWFKAEIEEWAYKQQNQGVPIWLTLEGFFWFPRKLMGIEEHLYAFYDTPELMHRINEDLLAFNLKKLDEFCELCIPDFITMAEDMSYNHGPMISQALFEEFMAPYYRKLMKKTKEYGIDVIIDSDGDITQLIPWFEELGAAGFLPLERQSKVDVAAIRERHPGLCLLGGFDKTVMHLGEEAMRKEFERLLPTIKQGGFIPSCDHQTPPQVSFGDYRLYVSLLKEYAILLH